MKKFFLMAFAAVFSLGASAQAHVEWTAAQLPSTVFESTDAAVAAGYETIWSAESYAEWLGIPSKNLIESENVVVSLPLSLNYVTTGNSKYSGYETYAYKLIMGMNNSTRNGIDASRFADGLEESGYVRQCGTSDQGNIIYDAVIQVDVAETAGYGVITLKYNRGIDYSAMYVVDVTKSFMVLQSVTRCPNENIRTHVAKFGVEPGHTYYIVASEKGAVELYGIAYDECADDGYTTLVSEDNSTDIWTADQLPSTVYETTESALADGYETFLQPMWKSWEGSYIAVKGGNLIESENVVVSLPLSLNYVTTGNRKYSGYETYAYKLIMGMHDTTRDGIDAAKFVDGLEASGYVAVAGTSDQGNTIYQSILELSVPSTGTCGRIILNYNRGDNNSAMYVVDATKQIMILQSITRNADDNIKTCSAIFNVEPSHTYYILSSENASVELYAIGYCSTTSSKYGALTTTGIRSAATGTTAAHVDNRIYSAAGRYVGVDASTLAPGLYICNGKKFIQK